MTDVGGRGGGGGRRVDPADRAQLDRSPVSLRRVAALFRPHRLPLAVVVVLIVASSAIALATPFLVRLVIDDALPRQDVGLLVAAVGGMVAVAAVTSVLGVVQTWLSTTVGQQVMHGLRTAVFGHLQRQSLGFFTRTRGGEVQSRLTNDIGGMQSVVTSTATSLASNATTVVGTVVAMVALSWRLSLLSLVVLPPAVWLTRRVARMRRAVTAQRQRTLAELNAQVEEGLSVSGVLLAKTLGAGPAQSRRFAGTSDELVALEVRSQLAGRWRMATMSIVFAGIPALIYLAAGLPATSGGMTIGTLVAFTTLQGALFRPLMGLLDVGVSVTSSMALFSRVFEYLDLPVDIADPPSPVPLDPAAVRGEVRLEAVGFRYPDAHRPALTAVDVTVPAGTTLALVGATGSGKTTLASLVARLADPTTGRVTIDGVDVRDYSLEELRSLVATAFEEPTLFSMSARENLTLGRADATEEEIEEALQIAQAGFVHELPWGLDTRVGEQGLSLSGGQRQRLALARAVLAQPKVLVLDDTLSALDVHTEKLVEEALRRVLAATTGLVVAHRASTVLLADKVALLQDGTITHVGQHRELLTNVPAYRELLAADSDELEEAAS